MKRTRHPAKQQQRRADACDRCQGTGEMPARHGVFSCPHCNGTGVKLMPQALPFPEVKQ